MNEQAARQRAAAAVEKIYGRLMETVIEGGVFNDRIGQPSDDLKKRLAKGTHIDPRRVRLMTISGKGGWSPDPEIAARYAGSRNVTLLDHLLSVARGAMVFAAMDWLLRNPEMEEAFLLRQLAGIAAIALLHDLDKDLRLARDADLSLDDIEAALNRYRLSEFLTAFGVEPSPAHLRYLIDKVEGTQAHRHDDPPPPRTLETLPPYVALADKLDGAWLSTDPEQGGLSGVQQRLQRDQTLASDLLRRWRTIDLFDPHHPFLLDELQRWLSWFSKRHSGTPPLIEQHLDGRLFMLLPEQEADAVIDQALGRLLRALPFGLEMTVSNRGLPQLHGIRPSYESLGSFLQETPEPRELAKLFQIQADLRPVVGDDLDQLLEETGLTVQWPNKAAGLLTPFSKPDDLMQEPVFTDAALLALLLHLKADLPNRSPIPDSDAREAQLLQRLDGAMRPEWIEAVADALSRRSLTALWAAARGLEDADTQDAIWGAEGLLQEWLEGNDDHAGLASCIHGKGDEVSTAVERHFRQLLEGRRVSPAEETGLGRCLFTNEPMPLKETIDSTTGLYEVKKSAFSGRDGRPENILNATGHTNVSAVSLAEHKLRKQVHGEQGGRADGIPALISTPATSGLFGGLAMADDKSVPAMSLYDLAREDKKGRVLIGPEPLRNRYRMARLESIPGRTADQADQLRLFLKAALRLGRPIHVFRGLPTSQPAFFYFDAMPRLLESLIGGKALRLEQIPAAIAELTLAHTLLDTPGLGYEVLRLYADPHTRLAGIALAWCVLNDRNSKDGHTLKTLRSRFDDATKEPTVMNSPDAPLIRLAQSAAEIQRYVGASASTSRQLMVFKLGFDALETARASGISDRDSLFNAVAGEIQQNLERRDEQAKRGGPLVDGCLKAAEILVDEVWLGICKGRAPTQRQRRIFGSIYRMSLLQTYRQRYADREHEQPEAETDTADN